MITFRYHIVSIVSVFLALAVGIALGGGPLKSEVDNTLVNQVEADRKAKMRLSEQVAELQGSMEFTDAFAAAVAPRLVGGSLSGRAVSVLVLPDASPTVVASVEKLIGEAGGSVGGVLRVSDQMLDVAKKQLVEELGSQLLETTPRLTVPSDAKGYEQMGALLARAIGTRRAEGARVDAAASSILSGLSTADLMSPDGDIPRRGSLVAVIAGPMAKATDATDGATSIAIALATALDAGTAGVVVAGPVSSAREGGLVDSVRRDVVAARDISTVDALGRTAGQVITVMALAEQAAGSTGHYGAVDAADGALPGQAPAD